MDKAADQNFDDEPVQASVSSRSIRQKKSERSMTDQINFAFRAKYKSKQNVSNVNPSMGASVGSVGRTF